MDELTVVVTCAASLVLPSTVAALKAQSARPCRFVGVDAADEPLASCYLDSFFQVPWATDPEYVNALLRVVQAAHAEALLVLSDAEAVVLSAPVVRQRFDAMGCAVLLPDHPVVATCVDKGRFMGFLHQHPATQENFHLVDEAHELLACAASFGYPDQPFVLKPRSGCGSRGVMVVDSSASPFDLLFERNYRRHTLESLQSALA